MDLGVDFDPAVFRDEVVRDGYTLVDWDSLFHNSIVFHAGKDGQCCTVEIILPGCLDLLGHAQHPINLSDAEPM
jgi:hypothetical protein